MNLAQLLRRFRLGAPAGTQDPIWAQYRPSVTIKDASAAGVMATVEIPEAPASASVLIEAWGCLSWSGTYVSGSIELVAGAERQRMPILVAASSGSFPFFLSTVVSAAAPLSLSLSYAWDSGQKEFTVAPVGLRAQLLG